LVAGLKLFWNKWFKHSEGEVPVRGHVANVTLSPLLLRIWPLDLVPM